MALGGKRPGAGRKSKYQEGMDAAFLHRVFTDKLSKEEIRAELKTGKYSIKDKWVSKMLDGNTTHIETLVHKIFPDNFKVTLTQKPTPILGKIKGKRDVPKHTDT